MSIKIIEYYLDKEEKFFDYQTQSVEGKDIFDLSKTGVSYYDNFLNSKDLEYMKRAKGLTGEIVYMTPVEYFEHTGKMFGKTGEQDYRDTIRNEENIEHLKQVILKHNKKFPLVYLNFSNNAQEGRHRMAVAAELVGKDVKFPVLVVSEHQNKQNENCDKGSKMKKFLRVVIEDAEYDKYSNDPEFEKNVKIVNSRKYWETVAKLLGRSLDRFKVGEHSREVKIGDLKIEHNWEQDGSPLKPVTYVHNGKNVNVMLGRYAVWKNPSWTADDIKEIIEDNKDLDESVSKKLTEDLDRFEKFQKELESKYKVEVEHFAEVSEDAFDLTSQSGGSINSYAIQELIDYVDSNGDARSYSVHIELEDNGEKIEPLFYGDIGDYDSNDFEMPGYDPVFVEIFGSLDDDDDYLDESINENASSNKILYYVPHVYEEKGEIYTDIDKLIISKKDGEWVYSSNYFGDAKGFENENEAYDAFNESMKKEFLNDWGIDYTAVTDLKTAREIERKYANEHEKSELEESVNESTSMNDPLKMARRDAEMSYETGHWFDLSSERDIENLIKEKMEEENWSRVDAEKYVNEYIRLFDDKDFLDDENLEESIKNSSSNTMGSRKYLAEEGKPKTLNLRRNGFVRAPEEDFSDDGNRFTGYYYDPDKSGDTRFVASKLIADGDAYISVSYYNPETGKSTYFDDLNGVDYQSAIDNIKELTNKIDQFKAKLDGGEIKAHELSDEDIVNIKNQANQIVDLTDDDYRAALGKVFDKLGINSEDLRADVRDQLFKDFESETRNSREDNPVLVQVLAKRALETVLKEMKGDQGGYDSRGRYTQGKPEKALEDALKDLDFYVSTYRSDKDSKELIDAGLPVDKLFYLNSLTDSNQEKIKNWVRRKAETLYDFDESRQIDSVNKLTERDLKEDESFKENVFTLVSEFYNLHVEDATKEEVIEFIEKKTIYLSENDKQNLNEDFKLMKKADDRIVFGNFKITLQ